MLLFVVNGDMNFESYFCCIQLGFSSPGEAASIGLGSQPAENQFGWSYSISS